MSTARKKPTRPTAAQKRRRIRTAILQRWDQLADDVHHLVQDIRAAPRGTFTEEEYNEAVSELDQTVWDVFCNSRPRLPASEFERRTTERNRAVTATFRRQWLRDMSDAELAEFLSNKCPKKLRAWLNGERLPGPKATATGSQQEARQ